MLASIIVFLGSHIIANAQSTAVAQVSGTVTDPSGAAIVNAQVSMTEVDKGAVH